MRKTLRLTKKPYMKHADVTVFQKAVKAKGHSPGPIDGIYGPQSDKACRAFQKANKLAVDGVCGPKTWAKLEQKAAPVPTQKPATKHFTLKEFACKDGTAVPKGYWRNTQQLMNRLEILRSELNKLFGSSTREIILVVSSGYRTPSHNRKCGGAANSQHLYGAAADIYACIKHANGTITSLLPNAYQVGKVADTLFNKDGGLGLGAQTYVHIDVRPGKSRWWYTFQSWAAWKKNQGKSA